MADPADDPDNDARASAAVAEPEEQDAQQQPQAPRGGVPVGPQQAPGSSQADIDASFAAAGYGKPSKDYTGGPLAPPGTPDTPQVQSPEDHYKEAYGAADKQFSDAYFKANPFKTSFDLPDTPRNWYAAAERAQDQKDALLQRQAQIAERQQALQQRQQRVATATQRENDMRANGQKFFRDPEGNIQPVLEPGTGRPLYDKTPWEEGVDPKTGAPALAMTDQYGQRQFKSFPIVAGGDPNDTQLYYRMPDGTTKPAGDAADLANSPDYGTAQKARLTLKNVHSAQYREFLGEAAKVVNSTKADMDAADARIKELGPLMDQKGTEISAAEADPNLNDTDKGILGTSLGAIPSEKANKAQAYLTMLHRQYDALDNESQSLTAGNKKGGDKYELHEAAALAHATALDDFKSGAYQHAMGIREAAVKNAGMDPNKDPVLRQMKIAQANHASGAASGVAMSAQRQQQRQSVPPVAPALPGTPPPGEPPPAGPAAGIAPPAPGSSPAPAPGTPAAPPPTQTGTPTPPPGPAPLVDRFAQTQQGKQPVGILGALISANQRAEKPLPMIGSESAGTKGGLFTIPKVYGTGAIPGILNAANEFTAGLTSPENAALLATTGGAGVVGDIAAGTRLALTVKGAQVAALAGFTAQGAGDTIEKTKAAYTVLHDPKATRADKAKAVAAAILSGAVTAAGAHGTRELATAPKGRVMPESPAAEFHPEAGTDQTGRAAKPTVVPTAATPPPAAPPAAAPPAGEQPSNPATAPGSTPLQPTHAEFTDNSPEAVAARAKANEPQMDPELRAELLKQGVHPPEAPAAAKRSLPPDAKVTYLGKKEPVLKGVGQPEDHWQVALPGEPRGVTVTRSELEKQGIDVSKLPTDEGLTPVKEGSTTNSNETRKPDQFQKGPQEKSGINREAETNREGTLSKRGMDAAYAWLQAVTSNDHEARANAEKELIGEQVPSTQRENNLPTSHDIGGSPIRAPGGDGGGNRPETGDVGTRTSSERERGGQPAGESGTSDEPSSSVKAPASGSSREIAPSQQAKVRSVVEAIRQVRDLRTESIPVRVTRHVQELLSQGAEGAEAKTTNDIKENTNATSTREQPSNRKQQHQGVPQGADLHENAPQVREGEGQQAGRGGRPAQRGKGQGPQAVPEAGQPERTAAAEPPRGNVAPQPDEGAPREGGVSPERGGAPREDVPNAPADARGAERPTEPAGAGTPAGGDERAVGEGLTPKKAEPTWQKFPASEKSLDVPRGEMPQVKSEDRPALVDALKEKGIASKNRMMKVADLKPTQAEFSPEKVQAAREHKGSDRKILVSKDGYIVDGHHQWMADKQDGSDNIPVTQIDAPIRKLLPEVSAFEKAKTGEGPKETRAPEEQPHAVVEKDGKDTKITPTPHAEAAVSKLATKKQIQAQRGFLLDAVAEAVKSAPEERKEGNQVTIHVPGDGTFTVDNTQAALTRFKGIVEKRFGKAHSIKIGNGVKGSSVSSPYSLEARSNSAPEASPVGALKSSPTAEDITKAVSASESGDTTRKNLSTTVQDGPFTVATDGRRLTVAQGGKGVDVAKFGDKQGEKYPNWKQVVPKEVVDIGKGGFAIKKDSGPYTRYNVKADDALRLVNMAASMTGEKATAVQLHETAPGTIGFAQENPELGDYASEGVKEGSKPLSSVNAGFLHDALTQVRAAGSNDARIYVKDNLSPIVITDGRKILSVVMPMKGDDEATFGGTFDALSKAADKAAAKEAATADTVTTPEKGVVSGSKAEAWADKVIKAGQGKARSGVSPSEFAAFAVKGVAVAERGIRDFAKWSAEMVKEFGDKIRPHLQDLHDAIMKHAPEETAQAEKPEKAPGRGNYYRSLPDTERTANEDIVRQVYQRRGQQPDLDSAQAIIDAKGPDEALRLSTSKADNGVPEPVKTAIYVKLAQAADQKFFDAKTPAEKAAALRARQALSTVKSPQATEAGQGISMFQQIGKSERGHAVDQHLSDVSEAQERKLGNDGKKALDEASDAVDKAKEDAIDKASDEMRKSLRQLKVGKSAWQKYREDAAAQMIKLVDSSAEPPKEQAPLKEFADRIIAEMKGRFKGLLPERPEGKPPPTAMEVMKEAMDNRERYGQVLTTVRDEMAKKYGEGSPPVDLVDTQLSNLELRPWSDRLLTKAIKTAHDAMGDKAADIARQHITKTDIKAGDIADALVKDAGISGADATRLASDLTDRAKEIYAQEREKALERLKEKFTNSTRAKQVFSAVQKAKTLSNLGAMTRADVHDAVVQELHLPQATPEQVQKIGDLADAVERAPDVASRARATLDLATELHKARDPGTLSKAIRTGTSLWYANMLSGLTVPVKALGDITNGIGQMGAAITANPAKAPELLKGWISGVPEGLERAASVMKSGRGSIDFDAAKGGDVTAKSPDPRRMSDLEDLTGKAAVYPGMMKYVPRTFRALEAMFAVPAREAYARLAATKLLEGDYSGKDLDSKVKETLGITREQFDGFKEQAQGEGFKGADAGLRVAQLMQEHRLSSPEGAAASEGADRFSRESVYANEPTGLMGVMYRWIKDGVDNRVKVAGVPILKPFLPFMKVPTNLLNESVNWAGYGAKRALAGTRDAEGVHSMPDADERNRLLVKAAAGSLLMGVTLHAALSKKRGDDTGFDITGNGPVDMAHRVELQQQGKRPHSFRVDGRWFNSMYTPLAVPMAIVGNVADALRYEKTPDQLLLGNKVADAVAGIGKSFVDTPMLEGLSNLAEIASGKTGAAKMGRFLAATGSSTVVPAAVRQIDQALDPREREASSMKDIAKAQIPFARRSLPVRTDALGDAVTYSPEQRIASAQKADPLRKALSDRNIAPSEPERQTKLGNRTMTDKEFNFYKTVSGRLIKARLDALRPGFYGKTDAAVQNEVRRVEETERKKVREQIGRMAGVH